MKTLATAGVCCVLVFGCASPPLQGISSPAEIDDDYVLALSVANGFLAAWRARHQDNGLAVLSPRLLKSKGEQWWRDEISGISNPHHESYEVTNGRRLPDGRYIFDVWLCEHYRGEAARRRARGEVVKPVKKWKPDRIILIKTGFEEWKVDEAPDI